MKVTLVVMVGSERLRLGGSCAAKGGRLGAPRVLCPHRLRRRGPALLPLSAKGARAGRRSCTADLQEIKEQREKDGG